ncbi:MAG: calcium-binding protein, partial [Planctomycetaceae bacterium]
DGDDDDFGPDDDEDDGDEGDFGPDGEEDDDSEDDGGTDGGSGDEGDGEASGIEITPLPADAPEGLDQVFAKQVNVFGVKVYATGQTSDSDVLHAATILAEYLDNNEDGVVDDPAVLEAMLNSRAGLVMFRDQAESEAAQEQYGELLFESGFGFQDLSGEETRPGGAADGQFDAALEEVLHLVTVYGYAQVYPAAFGFSETSRLTQAMDIARGGHFEEVPQQYPAGAWFTYDDETCDYGCMAVEYFYWGLTSILGGQEFEGRLDEIENEWRLNTRDKMEATDTALFTLLTDSGFQLPTVLPDGNYRVLIDDDGGFPDDSEAGGTGHSGETPGVVTVSLPSGDSDVTIQGNSLVVTQDGAEVSSIPLAAVNTLMIHGSSSADSLVIDLRNGGDLNLQQISVMAGDGDDRVTMLGVTSGQTPIVSVSGEGGHDLLIGSSGDEQLDGGDGNDTLIGGAGRDELRGAGGDDVLIGNGGNDTLDGGSGNDFARGDAGHDDLTAGSGTDVLLGRAGNDTLRFTSGIDAASGGAGRNVMLEDTTSVDAVPETGGAHLTVAIPDTGGPVSLTIRNGSLVVSQDGTIQRRIMLATTETMTIVGAAGDDHLDIDFGTPGAAHLDSLTIDGQGGADQITLRGLAATLADSVFASGGTGDDVITFDRQIRQSVTVNGGTGNDSIITAGGRDVIHGGDGNDFIDGGASRDVIRGDRGHDLIFGRGGSDRIYAGSGFDTVNGNGGNDLILGNSGNDLLKGASGNDRLIGHGGDDILRGDAGDDTLQAGDGHDSLFGHAGNDALAAGNGNDLLFGHAGDDSLLAGDGDDLAAGHAGRDIVLGESGNDVVMGHGGQDVLSGGDGTDDVTGSETEIDEGFTFVADWIDGV